MKRKTALLYVLIGILLAGLYFVEKGRKARSKITIVPGTRVGEQPPGSITFPKIDRRPPAANYHWGKVTELPTYNADSRDFWKVDLRSRDLSGLNLRSSLETLSYARFNDSTAWPAENQMPQGFDPKHIMELGKHPGPGIRGLHTQGITGEGVGIAIINQILLVDHQEYRNQLRLYEETDDITDGRSQMFGVAMASLAVGKTVGVAPGADLYYIATRRGGSERKFNDFRYVSKSIRGFLKLNEGLPQDRKIRVIAMAKGWSEGVMGYEDVAQAAQAAKAAGMWLVYPGDKQEHGFRLGGLGRSPLADPNSFVSYEPSALDLREEQAKLYDSDRLFVPLDSRTTASPLGNDEYAFYRQGYPGWSVSYIAGIYALAVQVEPTVTPERFWSLARQTGRTLKVDNQGETVSLGPIVDPVVLIRTLRESSDKLD